MCCHVEETRSRKWSISHINKTNASLNVMKYVDVIDPTKHKNYWNIGKGKVMRGGWMIPSKTLDLEQFVSLLMTN